MLPVGLLPNKVGNLKNYFCLSDLWILPITFYCKKKRKKWKINQSLNDIYTNVFCSCLSIKVPSKT